MVPEVPPSDTTRVAAVADHLDFLLDGLHMHHTTEDDLIWPKLLQRTRLDAPVTDGYWVAWSADLVDPTTAGEADEGPWDGATMTWYDADDEPLGDAPVFL